jgi:acyl-CoA hydrolase
VLTQMMNPEHANPLGNVHGGWVLKLIDEAGGIVASRHARNPAVTVEIDSVSFREPVHVGNLVHVRARMVRAWRTSMEVEATVEAENPLTGERRITSQAYLVYVALNHAGRPTPVPPVLPETDEERRKYEDAELRPRRTARPPRTRTVAPIAYSSRCAPLSSRCFLRYFINGVPPVPTRVGFLASLACCL